MATDKHLCLSCDTNWAWAPCTGLVADWNFRSFISSKLLHKTLFERWCNWKSADMWFRFQLLYRRWSGFCEEEEHEELVQPSSWGLPQQHGKRGVNNLFSGGAVGIKLNEAPHMNKDYAPLCLLKQHFSWNFLSASGRDESQCYKEYLDILDEGSHSAPNVTDSEIFMFWGIIVQMKQ